MDRQDRTDRQRQASTEEVVRVSDHSTILEIISQQGNNKLFWKPMKQENDVDRPIMRDFSITGK